MLISVILSKYKLQAQIPTIPSLVSFLWFTCAEVIPEHSPPPHTKMLCKTGDWCLCRTEPSSLPFKWKPWNLIPRCPAKVSYVPASQIFRRGNEMPPGIELAWIEILDTRHGQRSQSQTKPGRAPDSSVFESSPRKKSWNFLVISTKVSLQAKLVHLVAGERQLGSSPMSFSSTCLELMHPVLRILTPGVAG